tara:strand:- start:2957 stop:4039 length:1083 start_codon:yes stop_codon:yes gene_type:complete
MAFSPPRKLIAALFGAISLFNVYAPLPSFAASALAAWEIKNDGVLELRTKKGVKLQAFFQSSGNGMGDRIWIDFPGELSRPRSLSGNGPIKEIRLGKPSKGKTRLVVEFVSSVKLNPAKLKLIGVAPDRWKLNLVDLPLRRITKIGEGNVKQNNSYKASIKPTTLIYNPSELPSVPRSVFRVVIDPGHGGPDPGAVGISGLRETDVVLDVARKTSMFLEAKGVKVLMTRNNDIDLDLPPRVNKANRSKANAFVSIHANASRGNKREVNGLETYYYTGYKGQTLARNIQEQIIRVSPGSPDRGVRRARFFVIRKTTMPAALVEIGFVTGRMDARRLSQEKHREKVAFAIAKGILNYLKEVS